MYFAGALDVADRDLDRIETVTLDVEGLPPWPQQILVLRQRQDISLRGARKGGRDIGESGIFDFEKDVLRGVECPVTGDILFELEVDTAVGADPTRKISACPWSSTVLSSASGEGEMSVE